MKYLRLLFHSPFYGVILFVYFNILLHFYGLKNEQGLLATIFFFILGAYEALGLPFALTFIFKRIKILKIFFLSLFAFYYALLCFYHLRMNSPADFGMTFSNADLLANSNSWNVVKDVYHPWDFPLIVVCALIPWLIWILEFIFKNEQKPLVKNKIIKICVLWGCICSLSALVFDYESPNKYTQYFQSARHYFFPSKMPFSPEEDDKLEFQYFKPQTSRNEKAPIVEVKNVFIIFMESFNVNYIEKLSSEGEEYTPVFNKLIKQGLYFENFYANSMQTAKGQFATLCSQIPHSRLKDMVDLKDIRFECLPTLLQRLGFYTVFMQGLSDLSFDNTGNFLKDHGFQEVHAMNDEFLTEEDKNNIWGWGVQDDILFKKSFDYLQKLNKPKTFLALATISNHMKFKGIPEQLKKIYPEAGDNSPMEKRFANSLHIADSFLKTFFDELEARGLKNTSLVILVGDHSFPMGEHHNYATENTFYNEIFKTPLLIIGPGIKASRIPYTVSQIDIAPTILELINAPEIPSNFRGKSAFDFTNHAIPLIQPYDGRYLSLIKDQKKIIYHARTNRFKLFDLSTDPTEKTDIYEEHINNDFFPWLKEMIFNDLVLEREQNQVK